MTHRMKYMLSFLLLSTVGSGWWYARQRGPEPVVMVQTQPMPPPTALSPTPRARFTPTARRGYWNIDVVGDFTLPPTKSLTFCGAGRNLHLNQDWSKLFRRGFTSIDKSRMVSEEYFSEDEQRAHPRRSRLSLSQRAISLGQNYFADPPFQLAWSRNSEKATETMFRRPDRAPNVRQTMARAASELAGGCVGFGDCPPGFMRNTYGKIYLDIENDGTSFGNRQEHANLYVYLFKTIKENADPQTEIGTLSPVPHNSYGYSKAADYTAGIDWLWSMPARQTASSRQRGMPDDIVGKSLGDYADFSMPGTYYVWPDFDYNSSHTHDGDRHWLAALLAEQEVNALLSPKRRIAWQWLFNTQSNAFPNSGKASHPAPPAVAEGVGIFYWFTGAYGAILWDDYTNLTPDQPSPGDPNLQGIGNDRNYACYEHYIHGLWRLFGHHADLFNGKEKYLNQNTECSFDGGKTWAKYNANQLKTQNLPFVRAIVNGNQILVAASRAYGRPGQVSTVKLRYVEDGYQFYTNLSLQGDEIFLGRATMTSSGARRASGSKKG